MKNIIIILISALLSLTTVAQRLQLNELTAGKWKERDLPDSAKWPDGTLHLNPGNPSFWFKDESNVDVVWNGFYFKDQKFVISKKSDLLIVHVDSTYENVSAFKIKINIIYKPGIDDIFFFEFN